MLIQKVADLKATHRWRAVDPETLPAQWELFAPLMRRALSNDDSMYNEREALYFILGGNWQLWAYGEPSPISICVTELIELPRNRRRCLIRYIVGEWWPFAQNLGKMEAYAREQGCTHIAALARKGLTRRLPEDWRAPQVWMIKDLTDG